MPYEHTDYLGDSLPAHPDANAVSCWHNETVSQLKGAIQEAGKNSVSARRWHSMKYMNVHK